MAIFVPATEETDQKKQNMSLQLIGGIVTTNTTNITTNTASIAQHEAAWTAYTPTATPASGSYTTAAITGRYKQIGKTIWVAVDLNVTSLGTAGGSSVSISLPVTNPVASTAGSGYNAASGAALGCAVSSGGTTLALVGTVAAQRWFASATYEVP